MTQAELDELTANADILGVADTKAVGVADEKAENKGANSANAAANFVATTNENSATGENSAATADIDTTNAAKTAAAADTTAANSAAADKTKDTASEWGGLPPPSTEHKVVHQLDEVTRDSEVKAIEMMERLETIEGFFSKSEGVLQSIKGVLARNAEIFGTLGAKFTQVQTFAEALKSNEDALAATKDIFGLLQQGQDEIFVAIDAMQYQDIHRQKIERAINVMRALSRYMNSLFEGEIDDSKRVASAVHIAGDDKEVMDDGDIEALIASLRGK